MSENSRAIAARVIDHVLRRGRSLDDALSAEHHLLEDNRDSGFIREISFGVLRWYPQLQRIVETLLHKPLRDKDRDVHALILIGLYQIRHLQTPPHAAVGETVDAARALRKPWAKSLLNAVLRGAIRREDELSNLVAESTPASLAHPQWLLDVLESDWPAQWREIASANNQRPPFTLRINQRRVTRDTYLKRLLEQGIDAAPTAYSDVGVVIEIPTPVEKLPGFLSGEASVQDEAAQLCCGLVASSPGHRILDACAAPGGKTSHLLESQDVNELVALDSSPTRVDRLRDGLKRLQLHASVICADACDVDQWWDGIPFDRVLIDAPCSGTGVVRRHPDIKLLRKPSDVDEFAKRQRSLLNALWRVVAPEGKLIYATCSVLRAENDAVIGSFVDDLDDVEVEHFPADWGIETEFGRQVLTGNRNMDGFYYARVRKTGAGKSVRGNDSVR